MIGENEQVIENTEDEVQLEKEPAPTSTTDNVGETSVEINIEELIAELEADAGMEHNTDEAATKKRLEEILEQRRQEHELAEMDEFDLVE